MGDQWFPAETPMLKPWLANLVDNPIVVQFVHRWLAFAVAAAVFLLAAKAWRHRLLLWGYALVAIVCAQILLGIATLISGVDIVIAVTHQATAVLLLGATVWVAHALGEAREQSAA